MIEWVSEDLIYAIHRDHLRLFGGADGVRDRTLLESALNRPKHKEALGAPSLFDLAAAYCYGIVRNHPFVDGNKRTGFMAAYTFLGLNGYDLIAPEVEATSIVLAAAAGEIGEEDLADWFRRNSSVIKR
jgi:death-on-curing protein